MGHLHPREAGRRARHTRLRKKVAGMVDRPRLAVFRSHQNLYVQLINDLAGKTIMGWSTLDERLSKLAQHGNIQAASALGKLVAEDTLKQGITTVVFDRGGYLYHGRVKALAEAVREGGLSV